MNPKHKQIFSTTATPKEDEMRQEVEESMHTGRFSADEIKQFDGFSKAMFAINDYMQPHYHLCAKQDQPSQSKFIELFVERVRKLDPQHVDLLMATPTFRNHKIVFERATEPRHIKGEDVPMFKTQLVLLLVAIAAHTLCGKDDVEYMQDILRALHIGYMLHLIELSIIKEAA